MASRRLPLLFLGSFLATRFEPSTNHRSARNLRSPSPASVLICLSLASFREPRNLPGTGPHQLVRRISTVNRTASLDRANYPDSRGNCAHVATIQLTAENRRAKPKKYAGKGPQASTFRFANHDLQRTTRPLFVIYHLLTSLSKPLTPNSVH